MSTAPKSKVRIIPANANGVDPRSGLPSGINPIQKRVAAYCRVSTDSAEQLTSYEAQVSHYTEYINERPDWITAGIYADEGITGTSTSRRVRFNAMIDDALAGKIDYIITKSISRFARNTLDCLNYVRQLKAVGVGILFEKENIDTLDSKSEILLTILSSLAQDESRNISENVKWGIRERFKNGKTSMPYSSFLGYCKGKNGEPEIVPEEADTVRLIYRLFLDGKNQKYIAKELERRKISSPRGGDKWHVSTITSILKNEKYKGDSLLQKTYTPDYLTKKPVANNGEVAQYYQENSHDGIISKDDFALVAAKFLKRAQCGKASQSSHPFADKIFCSECGSIYGSKVWHSNTPNRKIIWRCNGKYKTKGKKACNSPTFSEREIQDAFINMVNKLIDDKATVVAGMEYMLEVKLDLKSVDAEILQLEQEASTCDEQCYDEVMERLLVLQNERVEKLAQRAGCEKMLIALKRQEGAIAEFDEALWYAVVERCEARDGEIWFKGRGGR